MKTHLGNYEIVSELGAGGMGRVYKAYEAALQRYVAIKELAPALAHNPILVERFLREARAMAALSDPHIVQIYSIGQDQDLPFFVMEFVDGESIAGILQRVQRLPVGDALKILYGSVLGLAVAHEQGVIHRDIKPANLILTQRGMVKLADFGIALAPQDFNNKLTGTGEFVGTPGYLPPEIWLGKPVDQRSDIFALGIVLFEMLVGKTPFDNTSPYQMMNDVIKTETPDVSALNNDVDASVSEILYKMLAKDPLDRYQSCRELLAALDKQPAIRLGGALQTKISALTGAAAAKIDSGPAWRPDAGTRVATPSPLSSPLPLPSVGGTSVRVSTPAPSPISAGGGPVSNADLKTRPQTPAPTSVMAAPRPPAARSSRMRWIAAGLLLSALLVVGWLLYGGAAIPPPGEAATAATESSVDATASSAKGTASAAKKKLAKLSHDAAARSEPMKREIAAAGRDVKSRVEILIAPLLRKLGLDVSPSTAVNVIAALLVLGLIRGFSLSRSRRRQVARTNNR